VGKVRTATREDIPSILILSRMMQAESPRYRHLPFSDEKTRNLISMLIENEDGLVLVSEDDGDIVGLFGALAVQHIFSEGRYAMDFANYVRPDHRGGMVSLRFVHAYEDWARGRGIPDTEIMLGVSTEPEGTDRLTKLYTRIGYSLSATTLRRKTP
jgi:GNAT superfamily N-acetyltransferase